MITAAGWRLRPAGPADTEALYRIYASTRQDELAATGWDAATAEAFLRMQCDAQDRHYRSAFPGASYDLITGGKEVLGRFYTNRGAAEWLVIDLALLPGHRGRGIGTRLLTGLLAEAGEAARPVRLHVEHASPARRLYQRLGFHEIADQGVYLLLERKPVPGPAPAPGTVS